MEVDASADIAAPPEEVWKVVADPARLHEWVTIHRALDPPPDGPLGVGSSFGQRLALAGREFRVTWTVSKLEKGRRLEWRGSGPAHSKARVSYRLEPSKRGTRFDYRNEFELPGGVLGAVAGRLVGARVGRREASGSLARLKRLLERR